MQRGRDDRQRSLQSRLGTEPQLNPSKENAMKRMEALALSFPSLEHAPGVSPWEPEVFAEWAAGPAPSHGTRCAAPLVLLVWNSYAEWPCGRFDLMDALACWDDRHRAAFIAWAQKPWWA